jgi:hypothetical protein
MTLAITDAETDSAQATKQLTDRALLLQPAHVAALVNAGSFYSTILPHRAMAQVAFRA